MSEDPRPSLADLPHRVRQRWSALPADWRLWREGFRRDPATIWRSPVIRIAGLILLGVVLIVGVDWLIGSLSPGPAGQAWGEATPWATLYVACVNPTCRASTTTHQAMDFDAWPLTCPTCGGQTVYRATRCSERRHWFAVEPGQPETCPFCAEQKAAQVPDEPVRQEPTFTDDDEDPW